MSVRDVIQAAAGAAGSSGASDPYMKNVSLLLSGDGTNGAQNNTFLDSSTNNFTITRTGNTTQGSFSPYGDLWSNYFDGSGGYLAFPDNAGFNFGTGDFTVETFIYHSGIGTGTNVYESIVGGNTSTTAYWNLYIDSSNNKVVWFGNDGVLRPTSTTISNNTWSHIAVSRSGTTLKIFINGVEGYSATVSTSYSLGTNGGRIGFDGPAGTATKNKYFYGYISNTRIVKGTAVYTTNFTPSTTPLTAVSGTSLLTCQSNRFKDNSSNNFTLTATGTPSVQRFSPFNPTEPYSASTIGGSGYFDGTTDYLSVAANTNLNIGSGNFTVEGWFNTSAPSASAGIVGAWNNNLFNIQLFNSKLTFAWAPYSTSVNGITGTTTIRANTWYHFAAVRNGNTFTLYLNGVSEGSFSTATTAASMTTPLIIGAVTVDDSIGRYFTGNISNIRVVKGTAVYTSNFTPPIAPVTAITNTSLLCNFTNAGIPDAAMQNDLETVGNAQVSTSVKKYGTGSLYFDGSGDWLTTPSNSTLTMGTGDFTAEMWVYPTTTAPSYQAILDNSWDAPSTAWQIILESGGYITLFNANGASANLTLTTSTTISANTWSHIAVVKSGTTVTIYINGVSGASGTMNVTFGRDAINYIGCQAGNAYPFNGYIDDLRITKGLARYTANFTPPAQALPTN